MSETERELPTLKPVAPIAICGVCNNKLYPNSQCRAYGPTPENCALHGDDWRRMMEIRSMQNTFVS